MTIRTREAYIDMAVNDPAALIALAQTETNPLDLLLIGLFSPLLPAGRRTAAATAMQTLLAHADPLVRVGAVYALGAFGRQDDYRSRATDDPDPRVRTCAQEWLAVNEPGAGRVGVAARGQR